LSPLDFAVHLLSFVAPALVVAIVVALTGRLVLPRSGRPQRWWLPLTLNFLAGVAVLAAGLWWFGRDGKMATYAALVIAVATCQWLSGRAWRS
jgi:zinc transporter ZupT